MGNLRIEEIICKLLKKVYVQDKTLKEMKVDIPRINKKIESYVGAFKQLDQYFSQMS